MGFTIQRGKAWKLLLLILASSCQASEITVTDDSRRSIRLDGTAERIISLAPHITELLFTAGAGNKIVGTVRYSDYPPAAGTIPRIGDTYNLDMERIIGLQPDLVILWRSGTRKALIKALEETGFPVYHSEPRSLEDIAATINAFGRLAGTRSTARQHSRMFIEQLSRLRNRYKSVKPVRVFYQFWHQPVFTVSGEHLINRVITLCGGENIFSDLPSLTPRVGMEDVLARDPEVIIASGKSESRPEWLDDWQQWPQVSAVANRRIHFIPPDLLLRHTSRILQGAELMCGFIDKAR